MTDLTRLDLSRCAAVCVALCAALAAGTVAAQTAGKPDPTAIAKAAIAHSRLPDKDGKAERTLVAALKALPPWAPFYPGALLGLDSGSDAPGTLQLGFSTADSEANVVAFYLQRLKARGTPTDLKERGVRTLEVSNSDQSQITSIILMPRGGGGVSGIIKHEGGGY